MADISTTEILSLPLSNQYASGSVTTFSNSDKYLERPTLSIQPKIGDSWHVITQGDRLDLLAYKYYGNLSADGTKLWWVLADANNVDNPFDLSSYVGRYFLIPDYFRLSLLLNTEPATLQIENGTLVNDDIGDYIVSDVTTQTSVGAFAFVQPDTALFLASPINNF